MIVKNDTFCLRWSSDLVSGHPRYDVKNKFRVWCAGETKIEAKSASDALAKWKLAFPEDYAWIAEN